MFYSHVSYELCYLIAGGYTYQNDLGYMQSEVARIHQIDEN